MGHLLPIVAGVLLAASATRSAGSRDPKTLTRLHDPVVIRTGLLHDLADHRTSAYRLYASRGGLLEAIPFQFDERGADGDLVLSRDGAAGDFVIDADDELVFMAMDTGDRAAALGMPEGSDAALELEVTDAGRQQRGWAYLAHFPGEPPPRSPRRYAAFDDTRDETRALYYRVSYSPERSNFVTGLRIEPAGGGSGEPLARRILMRINPIFSLLVTTWAPMFTEESFTVVTEGIRNGPVRAVRRVRQSLDLGRFFPEIPNGEVETIYYFSSFVTPSTFSVPALVLAALRDFRFESVNDFGAAAAGMRYWDAANPEGLAFDADGRPAGAEQDHDWWVVSGPAGTYLHALVIPPEWRAWGIARGTVVRRDDGMFAGTQGRGVGYALLNMRNLRAPGAYQISSAWVVLPRPYRPGDQTEALAMLRDPLRVEVRPVPVAR